MNISYHPVARTRARWRRRSTARGFTLVEMIVTLAIVGILAMIAAPSFSAFIANQRVRMASYDLFADLSLARSEAVKRNANVTIARPVGAGSTWAAGWTITDSNGNTLRTHSALSSTIKETTGPASVVFILDGHLNGATATFTFGDAVTPPRAEVRTRTITLDPSGRPKTS